MDEIKKKIEQARLAQKVGVSPTIKVRVAQPPEGTPTDDPGQASNTENPDVPEEDPPQIDPSEAEVETPSATDPAPSNQPDPAKEEEKLENLEIKPDHPDEPGALANSDKDNELDKEGQDVKRTDEEKTAILAAVKEGEILNKDLIIEALPWPSISDGPTRTPSGLSIDILPKLESDASLESLSEFLLGFAPDDLVASLPEIPISSVYEFDLWGLKLNSDKYRHGTSVLEEANYKSMVVELDRIYTAREPANLMGFISSKRSVALVRDDTVITLDQDSITMSQYDLQVVENYLYQSEALMNEIALLMGANLVAPHASGYPYAYTSAPVVPAANLDTPQQIRLMIGRARLDAEPSSVFRHTRILKPTTDTYKQTRLGQLLRPDSVVSVHHNSCPIIGDTIFNDGAVIPPWTVWNRNMAMDLVVPLLAGGSACACDSMLDTVSPLRAYILPNVSARLKGYLSSEFFFAHSIRAPPPGWIALHTIDVIPAPPAGLVRVGILPQLEDEEEPESAHLETSKCKPRAVTDQGLYVAPNLDYTSEFPSQPTTEQPQAQMPWWTGAHKRRIPRRVSQSTSTQQAAPSTGAAPEAVVPRQGRFGPAMKALPKASRQRFGNHSIEGDGMVKPAGKMLGADVQQNVVQWMDANMHNADEYVRWTDDNMSLNMSCRMFVTEPGHEARVHIPNDGFRVWTAVGDRQVRAIMTQGNSIGRCDLLPLAEYRSTPTSWDNKKLGSRIAGTVGIDDLIGRSICGLIDYALDRFDNSAMYTKIVCLALTRLLVTEHDARTGQPANLQFAPLDDSFVVRWWAADNIQVILKADIEDRAIIVPVEEWDPVSVNCLLHASKRGCLYATEGGDHDGTMPALNRYSWFPIRVRAYYNTQRNRPPLEDFTYDDMLTMAHRLADERNEMDMFVQGFTRACALMSQVRIAVERPAGSVHPDYEWYTCTAEFGYSLDLYTVTDYNILYRMALDQPIREEAAKYWEEAVAITRLAVDDVLRVATGIGAILSLGVGLIFANFNLTGRALAMYTERGGASGQNTLRTTCDILFLPRKTSEPADIYKLAATEIANVSQIVISPKAFLQRTWCSGFRDMRERTRNHHWGRDWNRRIPYIIDPFVAAWMLEGWPSALGVMQSNITIDVTKEVTRTGVSAGWYAARGDHLYTDISTQGDSHPYMLIAYGPLVINALCQNGRLARPNIRWDAYIASRSGVPEPRRANNWINLGDDDYIAAINTFKPGRLISYDWETQEVAAPILLENQFDNSLWPVITKQPDVPLRRCGISTTEHEPILTKVYGAATGEDLLAILGKRVGSNTGGGSAGAAESGDKASEN